MEPIITHSLLRSRPQWVLGMQYAEMHMWLIIYHIGGPQSTPFVLDSSLKKKFVSSSIADFPMVESLLSMAIKLGYTKHCTVASRTESAVRLVPAWICGCRLLKPSCQIPTSAWWRVEWAPARSSIVALSVRNRNRSASLLRKQHHTGGLPKI